MPLAGKVSSEVVPGFSLLHGILAAYTFSLSPDGKRLAYLVSIMDPASKAVATRIAPLDIGSGKPPRLLTPTRTSSLVRSSLPAGKC